MPDLGLVRRAWIDSEPKYRLLAEAVGARISDLIRRNGIYGTVTSRAKALDSLLRKLLKYPALNYEGLQDLAGARVVVRYRHEVEQVMTIVSEGFGAVTTKPFKHPPDRVGYLGTHMVIKTTESCPGAGIASGLLCEIQIRTLAQDLWAQMAHHLNYKPVVNVPEDYSRRVHLLSGSIELADREFARLNKEMQELPGFPELNVLNALEREYWKLTGVPWDRELSLEVLPVLLPLYGQMSPTHWATYFEEFVSARGRDLETIFGEQQNLLDRSVFLFQPEVLMIFDQLTRRPAMLRAVWSKKFPYNELERLAVLWAVSFD